MEVKKVRTYRAGDKVYDMLKSRWEKRGVNALSYFVMASEALERESQMFHYKKPITKQDD